MTVVGMLDTLSLKNTRLGLETLDLMGYANERVVLVLNRADSRVGISDDDVQRIVGRKPQIRVPSDVEVTRSVNDGRPIVLSRPKSEAAQSFRKLAETYMARSKGGAVSDEAPVVEAEQPQQSSMVSKLPRLPLLARRH